MKNARVRKVENRLFFQIDFERLISGGVKLTSQEIQKTLHNDPLNGLCNMLSNVIKNGAVPIFI
jgi:hypothetical protein